MDISYWRKKIDGIDKKILELLNQRIECVINIGKIKKEKGIPLYSAEREEKIFQTLISENKHYLEEANIRNVFEKIIEISKCIESKYCKQL